MVNGYITEVEGEERAYVDAWPADELDAALDQYEQELSDRLNKDVTLTNGFREQVHEAYGLSEDEARERYEDIRDEDVLSVACPHCVKPVELARERAGLEAGSDPSLKTKAHTVRTEDDESFADVLERREDTVDDLFDLDDTVYTNFDGADLRDLAEDGVREGPVYREIYCEKHDEASLAIVGEGKAEFEDGMLKPRVIPLPAE